MKISGCNEHKHYSRWDPPALCSALRRCVSLHSAFFKFQPVFCDHIAVLVVHRYPNSGSQNKSRGHPAAASSTFTRSCSASLHLQCPKKLRRGVNRSGFVEQIHQTPKSGHHKDSSSEVPRSHATAEAGMGLASLIFLLGSLGEFLWNS